MREIYSRAHELVWAEFLSGAPTTSVTGSVPGAGTAERRPEQTPQDSGSGLVPQAHGGSRERTRQVLFAS